MLKIILTLLFRDQIKTSWNKQMKKNVLRVLVIACLILFVPLLGNIFVNGWNWSILDFIFAFVMLFCTGLAIDFCARKIRRSIYRLLAIVGIVILFLIIWVELAVNAVSRVLDLLLS